MFLDRWLPWGFPKGSPPPPRSPNAATTLRSYIPGTSGSTTCRCLPSFNIHFLSPDIRHLSSLLQRPTAVPMPPTGVSFHIWDGLPQSGTSAGNVAGEATSEAAQT